MVHHHHGGTRHPRLPRRTHHLPAPTDLSARSRSQTGAKAGTRVATPVWRATADFSPTRPLTQLPFSCPISTITPFPSMPSLTHPPPPCPAPTPAHALAPTPLPTPGVRLALYPAQPCAARGMGSRCRPPRAREPARAGERDAGAGAASLG